ncbi:MAG: OstA family protein [Firmicutes bacterium]|nr:OstA family protein [Bacillota bacterium]
MVKADRQYHDFEKGLYVLNGNVVIEYNGYHVTAVEAKTDLVEVWANGGITFQKDDIQMSGSIIYSNFHQNILKVQGAVDFSRNKLRITADKVEFNWETKLAKFTGNVRVQNGDTISTHDTTIYNLGTNGFLGWNSF